LIFQDILAEIKLATDKLEQEFCTEGKRRVNIDPPDLSWPGRICRSDAYIPEKFFQTLTMDLSGLCLTRSGRVLEQGKKILSERAQRGESLTRSNGWRRLK